MTNYSAQPIGEFLAGTASTHVTPAGGSATAVVGAIGASLCEMVCVHTVEKADGGAVPPAVVEAGERLETGRERLLRLADADAEVVVALFGSDGNPRNERLLKRAVGVPLTIARACLTVIETAEVVAETGTRIALPDAATGVMLARSALQASLFTVRSNLDHVPDRVFGDGIERRAAELERSTEEATDHVLRTVDRRLSDAG